MLVIGFTSVVVWFATNIHLTPWNIIVTLVINMVSSIAYHNKESRKLL